MARVKRWCLTLNHWTSDEYAVIFPLDGQGCYQLAGVLEYAILGKETGATGNPHLQGFVVFKERTRLATARALLPRAHWESARDSAASIEYCKKEGNFFELGTKPPEGQQGRRNDIESLKDAVKSGVVDRKVLREDFSFVCAQYPKFVESYIRDQTTPPPLVDYPLRDWQQRLVEIALGPIDERAIHFVVDIDGNSGKSYLASYCEAKLDRIVQVMKPGKLADMAYEYREDTQVFILDCPRAKQGDYIQYDFLESLKDGRLFSCKYESRTKRFIPPHVFVFMNQSPDMEKLSVDRYCFVPID